MWFRQLPAQAGGDDLKPLLEQLVGLIEQSRTSQAVSEDDAKDALGEVETVAESAKTPNDEGLLDKAKKAVRGLGRIFKGVAPVVSVVEKLGKFIGVA